MECRITERRGMTDLPALLTRLRAATGPDRALDAEIAALLRIVSSFDPTNYIVPLIYRASDRRGFVEVACIHPDGKEYLRAKRPAPAFTGSVDAAMTLIPPGWQTAKLIQSFNKPPARQYCHATLERDCDSTGRDLEIDEEDEVSASNFHTLPLAICAVALEARRS